MITLLGKIQRWFLNHYYLEATIEDLVNDANKYEARWHQAEELAESYIEMNGRAQDELSRLRKELDDYHYRLDCRFCQTKTVCANCATRNGAKSLCQSCGGLGIDLKPFTNPQGLRVNVCKKCREQAGVVDLPGGPQHDNSQDILAPPAHIKEFTDPKGRRRELPPGCTNTDSNRLSWEEPTL